MNTTSKPTFVSASTKLSRLTGLFNKVLTSPADDNINPLDELIDDMLKKDPKLLCRLNFKNPQVKSKIRKLLDDGIISMATLMYEPQDTLIVREKPAPRIAKRTRKRKSDYRGTRRIPIQTAPKPSKRGKKMINVSTDCDAWLNELDRKWAAKEKNSSESGIFEAICS